MEILINFWDLYLYTPLFNLLIWIYTYYAFFHLGIAIIILTLLVRIVLLPFSILTERGKIVSSRLKKEVKEIRKDYANDIVAQKIAVRKLLKKKGIRPWAKAVALSFQALIIILLYQVFVGGIDTVAKLDLLYPGVPKPDFINTRFLWFDLAQRDLVASAIVSGFVFATILIGYYQSKRGLNRKDNIYSILFPAFTFLILAVLPSAKSVFILTSLIFSSIISLVTATIKMSTKKAKNNNAAKS